MQLENYWEVVIFIGIAIKYMQYLELLRFIIDFFKYIYCLDFMKNLKKNVDLF